MKTSETAFNVTFGTDLAYYLYRESRPDHEKESDSHIKASLRFMVAQDHNISLVTFLRNPLAIAHRWSILAIVVAASRSHF